MCQLSIYNSFPVIRTTIAKKSSFLRTPAFIFCFPWDAPVAITQNVAWMKRQFSACQTPRSMYPSIFRESFTRGGPWVWLEKLLLGCFIFGTEKLEWLGYQMVKKFRRYLYSFWCNSRTWQTDRQMDRHHVPAIASLMHSIARQKSIAQWKNDWMWLESRMEARFSIFSANRCDWISISCSETCWTYWLFCTFRTSDTLLHISRLKQKRITS